MMNNSLHFVKEKFIFVEFEIEGERLFFLNLTYTMKTELIFKYVLHVNIE